MKLAYIVFTSLLLAAGTAYGQENEAKEKAEAAAAAKNAPALAAALKGAKITLGNGLSAAEASGQPISAKFEVEKGKLQLSVYTTKHGEFYEAIVDYKTGKLARAETITDKEDIEAARDQASAMADAKRSLRDVVAEAEKANPGYRAVSVTPETQNGVVNADVALLKGTQSKYSEHQL